MAALTGGIVGDVADSGALVFDRMNTLTFPGVISGSGSVSQIGFGTTILTADSPYTGGTTVSRGALAVGDFAHPSAALSGGGPITVQSRGTLGGYGSVSGPTVNNGVDRRRKRDARVCRVADRDVHHPWRRAQSGADPARLRSEHRQCARGSRRYVGAGARMAINTFLGGDGSPSDRLVMNGDPAATGNTAIHVTNIGGTGALTTANGILVVDAINGATTAPGAFNLSNGELRAGAFDYRLFRGGVSGSPNDWFLRSSFIEPPIPPVPPTPANAPARAPPRSSGPSSRPMAWCSLWRGSWASRSSARSTSGSATRIEPDGCTVAPPPRPRLSICRPGSLSRRKRPPRRRARCSRLRPGAASSARRSTITISRSPTRAPRQPGRLPGRRRPSARLADRRPFGARRPLWRLWRRERRRERPHHQCGGDRRHPRAHRIDEPRPPGRRAGTGPMSGLAAGIPTPFCREPGMAARPAPNSRS